MLSQVLQACNFDPQVAAEALLDGSTNELLKQWATVSKKGSTIKVKPALALRILPRACVRAHAYVGLIAMQRTQVGTNAHPIAPKLPHHQMLKSHRRCHIIG